MIDRPLPWQEEAWRRVIRARDADRLGHALILTGPTGNGVTEFAQLLMRTLLCEAVADGLPCGSCTTCRQVVAGTHPDIFSVFPEEPGKSIGVDAIRGLIERVNLTAGGAAKAGIIEPAEAMTINAANSLLKTLEEPPAGTHLLLVTPHAARLPATIRSRCQQVGLPLPPREQALAWLEQQGVADCGQWLALSGGRPLTALELASTSGDEAANSEMAATALLDVLEGRAAPAVAAADLTGQPLGDVVMQWIATAEDMVRLCNAPSVRITDESRRDRMQTLSGRLDVRELFLYLDALHRSLPGPGSSLNAVMQIQGLLADARRCLNSRSGQRGGE